jgi:ABC-2 type transport system permease protein
MKSLWNNPELIRHARADLRPARMLTIGIISIIVCALIILLFYHPGEPQKTSYESHDLLSALYVTLLSAQALVLCLWCLTSCSQAISSERNLKTFDFLRTTRLSPAELLLGMVFGAPVTAYFAVACSVPFSVVVGLTAGYSPLAIAVTYAMLLLVAVVLSLAALTLSLMTDRPRAGEVVLLLIVFGWPAVVFLMASTGESRFPGLTAIPVVIGLLPLYHVAPTVGQFAHFMHVPFFGVQVPSLLVSIVLYASAAAWLVLMLVRNLKKDREDIRLLSRWQGIAFTIYVNLLVFALLDLGPMYSPATNRVENVSASDVSAGYLVLNFIILYAVGLATLAPAARLKTWFRHSAQDLRQFWSEDGPPWPWITASSVAAFLLFVAEAAMSTKFVAFADWSIPAVAWHLFVLLVFAVRDILFLQWCAVKGFQRPVVKGTLFLTLYYVTAFIVAIFFFKSSLSLFTPIGAFDLPDLAAPLSTVVGVVLQIAVSIGLLISIRDRLAPAVARSTSIAPSA